MSLTPEERSDVRHLYNAGQDFWTPYAGGDDKGKGPFYNTDNGLRLEFDYQMYLLQKQIQRFTIYSSRSSSPKKGITCKNSSTRWQRRLLGYSSILSSPRTKDSWPLPWLALFRSPILMEQETELGYRSNVPVLLSITGKEGHHSEPITFYLADLGQEILF